MLLLEINLIQAQRSPLQQIIQANGTNWNKLPSPGIYTTCFNPTVLKRPFKVSPHIYLYNPLSRLLVYIIIIYENKI